MVPQQYYYEVSRGGVGGEDWCSNKKLTLLRAAVEFEGVNSLPVTFRMTEILPAEPGSEDKANDKCSPEAMEAISLKEPKKANRIYPQYPFQSRRAGQSAPLTNIPPG